MSIEGNGPLKTGTFDLWGLEEALKADHGCEGKCDADGQGVVGDFLHRVWDELGKNHPEHGPGGQA